MESINTEFKNNLIKPGNEHMSRNEYIEFIRKQHKKILNTKSYDMNYHNILKFPINENIKEENNINSNSKEKNISIVNQVKSNINNQIIKVHKKTNSLTIQLEQKFKKKSIIKSPPKKKQAKIIYKNNKNNPLYQNIYSIEEISNENIGYEPRIQNENFIEKENSTLSTSKITTPEKINNDSFENYDSIIINGEDNRKVKYFIKSARNKTNNSNYFKCVNSTDNSNNKCNSSRDNENQNNINNKFFSYYSSFDNYPYVNNNDLSLNIEDLIMIEDKFNKLIKSVNEENTNYINKICFEWWNYYFNCSFKGNCDYLFAEFGNQNLITYHNTLLLISIILIYDLSFKHKFFCKISDYMKKIILINYQNYLSICLSLINRIKPEYLNSKWVEQLKEIIFSKISKNNNFFSNELEKNLYSLNQLLSIVINIFNNNNFILNSKIPILYKNYMKYDAETINKIFMTNIIHIENKGGSLLYSTRSQSNPVINSFFLKNPPSKHLTLVLDLDETLMSFIYINNESKEGLLRIRPYLYNFLNLVKEYYEIIIFTAATQNYADPILDNIEVRRGKYFNYRLYREHCSIINNDFIKDISLIGRDLSKVIIVDNMQQNFKLQKENGILISSFWGEDDNDKVLLQLGRILVSIAIDMVEAKYNLDVRNEIKKYKEDIIKSVSMS